MSDENRIAGTDDAGNGDNLGVSDRHLANNSNSEHHRTLYVGNLHPDVNEDFIRALFTAMGQVDGVKIIREPGNDPYCFVEFAEHSAAANALLTMKGRMCMNRELKINWATSPGTSGPKQDTSKHYHIFVGDLSPEIETKALKEAFSPFGEISDCRVVRDPQSLKSKGYGFVSYVKRSDAELAINTMNGQWLGSRAIRTNWATRKPPTRSGGAGGGGGGGAAFDITSGGSSSGKHLSFEEVYHQSSPSNCTVYCGGILQGLSDELIQKRFSHYGQIQEIRTFKEKGYAFIKFTTKEAATNAILATHNSEINGHVVKCSWGKETGDPCNNQISAASAVAAGFGAYPYHQAAMGYWFPQTSGYTNQTHLQGASYGPASAAAATAAVQPIQTYPYAAAANQYYNTAATTGAGPGFNAAAAVGMQMAWQGAAPTGLQGAAGQPHHLASHQNPLGQGLQQTAVAMIGHYSMQPYQAQ